MEGQIKLCIDCKWCRQGVAMDYRLCYSPHVGRNLVTGEARPDLANTQRHILTQDALMYREVPELWCGPSARYFEPKDE